MPRRGPLPAATAAVFAVTLAAYAATLYPTVPGGDSGELVAVASRLGVVHPPGYPLWTLLAWLFTLLPFGSAAWRVALLSAVCTAGAAALIFRTVADFLGDALATEREAERAGAGDDGSVVACCGGLVAAAAFAFSPTVWGYAVEAEVFPLNSFFVALLALLTLRWQRLRDPRVAHAVAATVGLGLTNHQTLLFYALPIALWLLVTGRNVLLTPRRLATLAAAGLAGLVPYTYLAVAGASHNPLSWGDTATLQGFLDHLLRRDYGTFRLIPDSSVVSSTYAAKLFAYASHFTRASVGVGPLLVLVAAVATVRSVLPSRSATAAGAAKKEAKPHGVSFMPGIATDAGAPGATETRRAEWIFLLAASVVFYVGVFHALANVAIDDAFFRGVLSRFWMQADATLCILAGIGFGHLAAHAGPRRRRVAAAGAALFVAAGIAASVGEREGRGEGVVEAYGRAILEPLPQNALLLTSGDLITNVVRYLQACENVRPDVVVLDQELMTKRWYIRNSAGEHPDLAFPGAFYNPGVAGAFSMRAFLDANGGKRSVWVYPDWKSGDPSTGGAWEAWPSGLASRVLAVADEPEPRKWLLDTASSLAGLDVFAWPPRDRFAAGSWESIVVDDVWQARHRRALFALREALAHDNDAGLLTIARGEFEAAARAHPSPPWYLFKNLGIVYERLALTAPSLRREQLTAWQHYLASAPADDPDRAAIADAVKQLEGSMPAAAQRSGI